jgi:hypothetical protein
VLVGVRINVPFLARLGAFRRGPSKRKYPTVARTERLVTSQAVYFHVGGGTGLDPNDMVSRCTIGTYEQRLRVRKIAPHGRHSADIASSPSARYWQAKVI